MSSITDSAKFNSNSHYYSAITSGPGSTVSQLVAGSGISVSPVGGTGVVTVSSTSVAEARNDGLNFPTTTGQIPANSTTTPIYTFTFDAGPTPCNVNAMAQIQLSNTSASPVIVYAQLYAGNTPSGALALITTVPANGAFMTINPTIFLTGISGSTTLNVLLYNSTNATIPGANYGNNGLISVVYGSV